MELAVAMSPVDATPYWPLIGAARLVNAMLLPEERVTVVGKPAENTTGDASGGVKLVVGDPSGRFSNVMLEDTNPWAAMVPANAFSMLRFFP